MENTPQSELFPKITNEKICAWEVSKHSLYIYIVIPI